MKDFIGTVKEGQRMELVCGLDGIITKVHNHKPDVSEKEIFFEGVVFPLSFEEPEIPVKWTGEGLAVGVNGAIYKELSLDCQAA